MKYYYIYRKDEETNEWQYIFRMKESNPNYVRVYLAENNFEGRYKWNTGKNSRKDYYTSLYR